MLTNKEIRRLRKNHFQSLYSAEMSDNYQVTVSEKVALWENLVKDHGLKLATFITNRSTSVDLIKDYQRRIGRLKFRLKMSKRFKACSDRAIEATTFEEASKILADYRKAYSEFHIAAMPLAIQDMDIKFSVSLQERNKS